MPFSRPTLQALIDEAAADVASALPGADALLPENNLTVLAFVLGAMTNGNYGFLDFIAQNAVPFTATGEFLEAWSAFKDITRLAATSASGSIAFTTTGANIPSGTPIQRGDGEPFVTVGDGTVVSTTVTVQAIDLNTGAQGNCPSGTAFTLGTAIGGVTSTGAASTAFTGAANVETDAALRTRMLKAYAAPPQGGDLADYINWALDVPGVTRAWAVGSTLGAGTVQVFFMMDVSEATYGGFPQGSNGVATAETRATPATGDQLAVANAIFPKRPVTAEVYAYAPLNNPVAITIAGLASSTTATRLAIQTAIAAAFLQYAAPGGVTDSDGNPIGVMDVSAIDAAILSVSGTTGFVVTAITCPNGTVTPGAAGNITSNTGYLATLGAIAYV
jgi:uncharacterized phage protein gp47/JayE